MGKREALISKIERTLGNKCKVKFELKNNITYWYAIDEFQDELIKVPNKIYEKPTDNQLLKDLYEEAKKFVSNPNNLQKLQVTKNIANEIETMFNK